jgi:thymidylate kinase
LVKIRELLMLLIEDFEPEDDEISHFLKKFTICWTELFRCERGRIMTIENNRNVIMLCIECSRKLRFARIAWNRC